MVEIKKYIISNMFSLLDFRLIDKSFDGTVEIEKMYGVKPDCKTEIIISSDDLTDEDLANFLKNGESPKV